MTRNGNNDDYADDATDTAGANSMASAPAYRMRNDARAKKVLKDLSRMLKEADVETKHPRLKAAVARLFGYTSWEHMDRSIGNAMEATGPEDHELEPALLAARQAEQKSALTGLGIPEAKAAELLTKLRPTGRTGGAVDALRRVPVVATRHDYHPYRLYGAWADLEAHADDFDGTSYGAEDLLASWGKGRRMHPLDAAVCDRPSSENEFNIDVALSVVWERHLVVDATAMVEELAEPVDPAMFEALPEAYYGDIYVHFGVNALPSPYPHVGVEGAYVTIDAGDEPGEPPISVGVKIVCSSPVHELLDHSEAPLEDVVQNLRDLMRGPYVNFSPSEGETFLDALAEQSEEEGYGAERWSEFVDMPMRIALNAVKAVSARRVPVVDAVLGELKPSLATRLERATTDEKIMRVVSDLDAGDVVVRYLGRPAPSPELETEGAPGYVATHLTDDGHLLEYLRDVRGYWGDRGPEVARRFVEAVLANTTDGPEAAFVKAECRSLMIRACLAAIAFDVGRDSYKEPEVVAWRDEAGAHIREAVEDASSFATMTMPLVWLSSYVLGFTEEAAVAWDRASGIRALQHGRLEELKALADEAVDDHGEDFASSAEFFMQPTYEQTATGNLRPYWDEWYSKEDLLPRTDALEAWVDGKVVPMTRR